MFAEVYRRQLGNRLLLNTSASDFIENEVIRKLKMKCGPHFTIKLEGMMTDLSLAKETDNKFQDYLNDKKCITINTQILSQGHWPTFKITSPNICQEFTDAITQFGIFYKTITNHRSLK
jgi:cullin 1